LNRVLAPEGEDLSCRDKKGPKETLPRSLRRSASGALCASHGRALRNSPGA